MAGHYFYDPRLFYGQNAHTGLMPMEELFHGNNEPVPYWMDQRMAPVPAIFDDFYYPGGYKQMVRRPEIMHQQYLPHRGENVFKPYRRQELVRDDTDMYRRSPYNFNYAGRGDGVGAVAPGGMHSEGMRGQQQPLLPLRAQDDTWVHTMSAPAQLGHGHQSYHGLPEPPPGAIPTRSLSFPSGNGSDQFRSGNNQYLNSDLNHSNDGGHTSNFNSNNHSNGGGHNTKQSMGASGNLGFSSQGQENGKFSSQSISLGQSTGGTKSGAIQSSMMSKQKNNHNSNTYNNNNSIQHSNAKRYKNDDSSSDSDDDDDYRNSAAMVKKHGHSSSTGGNKTSSGHGHNVDSHSYGGFESNSRGLKNNSSSQSMIVSSQKPSSHGSHGSHGKHSSGVKQSSGPASRISKLLGFQSDDSSSSDDESYNSHSKNGGSKSTSMNQHGTHVSSYQAPTYGNSQPKQMQFSSQSMSVELQVPICCDNCERKVRACLEKMDGVASVLCDQWNRKVIVYGNVKAENVLKRVRRVKKFSELWQNAKQQQNFQNQQHQLRLSF